MALSAAGLAAAITAEQGAPASPEGIAIQNDANLKLATAIVNYIVANATVVVASVTGVTAGGAASGPGTGTIT